jgi:hypothetical protein
VRRAAGTRGHYGMSICLRIKGHVEGNKTWRRNDQGSPYM